MYSKENQINQKLVCDKLNNTKLMLQSNSTLEKRKAAGRYGTPEVLENTQV